MTIKNRVVSSGHDTVMAAGGLVSDQMVAYHAARARGGVGPAAKTGTAAAGRTGCG